jgi:hypothetical protein
MGRSLESIHIIQKEDEKNEEFIKDTVHTEPPYDENTPCIDFNEGSLVLMWDKRKGKPRYEQKTTILGLALTSSGRSLTKKGTI